MSKLELRVERCIFLTKNRTAVYILNYRYLNGTQKAVNWPIDTIYDLRYCPCCKGISTKATDRRLGQGTANLLKLLLRSPGRVVQEPELDRAEAGSVIEQETAFRELLNTPGFDEKLARQMVFDLAAARFAVLSGQHYETMRIRYLLEQSTADTEIPVLLRQIASAVLIHPDGSVSLKLKNGQVIHEE